MPPSKTPELQEFGIQRDAPLRGRYRLGPLLGTGGSGAVFRAVDLATEEPVAVKLISDLDAPAKKRLSREVAALQLLRVEGVVRLIDHGEVGRGYFIAMDLVEGKRFPGSDTHTWDTVCKPTLGLLETLAYIHDEGVVHRDLKPENILVDGNGRPIVLDFGLARGAPVGSTVTQSGIVLGTPRYLAPEQMHGSRVDHRADLYAVGVMLYEALAGIPPQVASSWSELARKRLFERPQSLRTHRPDLPQNVWHTVDQLLERDPSERPAGARSVLAAFTGEDRIDDRVPWLGDIGWLDAVLARIDRGEAFTVGGPPRSGKSRLLREIASRHPVRWLVPGSRAFSSTRGIVDDLAGRSFDGPRDALAHVAEVLQRTLDERECLVADAGLDQWSERALEGLHGPVVRVVSHDPDVRCEPLQELHLRGLFHGPDRVLHLQEDAARELWRRTEGLAGDVIIELRAWERAGWCTEDGGRFRIERAVLDRLAAEQPPRRLSVPHGVVLDTLGRDLQDLVAWIQLAGSHATVERIASLTDRTTWELELELEALEEAGALRRRRQRLETRASGQVLLGWSSERRRSAHRAIASALPEGTRDRLQHMLAGGLTTGLLDEAEQVARQFEREGRLADAQTALEQTLAVAGEARKSVLEMVLRLALDQGTRESFLRAAGLVDEHAGVAGELVVALARAARLARGGRGTEALEILNALPVFSDPDLESARRVATMTAMRHATGDDSEVLEALVGGSPRDPRALTWLGLLRYRQRRIVEAARAHEQAAPLWQGVALRLGSLLNAASCRMMLGEHQTTLDLAGSCLQQARSARLPGLELRAELFVRAAKMRMGTPTPAADLVRAAVYIGGRNAGLVVRGEAYIAMRCGQEDAARTFARQARTLLAEASAHSAVLGCDAMMLDSDAPSAWLDLAARAEGFARLDILALGCRRTRDPEVVRELARTLASLPDKFPHPGLFSMAEVKDLLKC